MRKYKLFSYITNDTKDKIDSFYSCIADKSRYSRSNLVEDCILIGLHFMKARIEKESNQQKQKN